MSPPADEHNQLTSTVDGCRRASTISVRVASTSRRQTKPRNGWPIRLVGIPTSSLLPRDRVPAIPLVEWWPANVAVTPTVVIQNRRVTGYRRGLWARPRQVLVALGAPTYGAMPWAYETSAFDAMGRFEREAIVQRTAGAGR